MKIPARVSQSRHGIYYYRFQFTAAGKRQERRVSLQTKNPVVAREKSLLVSAILVANKAGINMSDQKEDAIKKVFEEIEAKARNLEVVYSSPHGHNVTLKADPNIPGDIEALLKVGKDFLNSELGQSFNLDRPKPAAPVQPVVAASPALPVAGGMTVEESIKRYATRQGPKLSPKTLYEYGNYQRIFKDWLKKRHNREHMPIREVSRQDLSAFIDDLLVQGIGHHTIQQKYLAAISGLFTLAQSEGSYPENAKLPSHGHKVLTKREAKKTQDKRSWKPFTDEELKTIFNPQTYLAQKNPTDYWLPLLGLFTGGRISELCQLMATTDIKKVGDVWAISITDEDECQRLKTPAAKRTIPVHPQLIDLGFLDFVEDMKPYGGMLFPYLTANPFGNFSETPSERFGKYLDSLGITDKKKVFHSFRSTSNNCLKQNGVPEETRCQFIGHEHDTVNSKNYSDVHSVAFLMEHVASKLDFAVDFKSIPYPREDIVTATKQKVRAKQRRENHKIAKAARQR